MRTPFSLKFLGTSSAPTPTRNYSSLLVKYGASTIMVDCGESTQRQFFNRYIGGEEKLSNLKTILITHLHQDHVLGLVSLLATISGPGGETSSGTTPRISIYGPSGLRALIRTNITLTYMTMSCPFVVHELLWPSQQAYPHFPSQLGGFQEPDLSLPGAIQGSQRFIPFLPPIENERPGLDFRLDLETMSWPCFCQVSDIQISAAPISHRVPTLGFAFQEAETSSGIPDWYLTELDSQKEDIQQSFNVKHPRSLIKRLTNDRETLVLPNGKVLEPPALDLKGRKLVVLGDTSDATGAFQDSNVGMTNLAKEADVLVHESTNVALPMRLNGGKKDENRDEVKAKALLRGHSTPQVAGSFAGKVRAKSLILNHFSSRYSAPHPRDIKPRFKNPSSSGIEETQASGEEENTRLSIMKEIENQATEAWHSSMPSNDPIDYGWRRRYAVAAYDGLSVPIRGAEEPFEQDLEKGSEFDQSFTSSSGVSSGRDLRSSPSSKSLRGSSSQSSFRGGGRGGKRGRNSVGDGERWERGRGRGGRGRRSLGNADQDQ